MVSLLIAVLQCGSALCVSKTCGSTICGSALCGSALCGSALCGSTICGTTFRLGETTTQLNYSVSSKYDCVDSYIIVSSCSTYSEIFQEVAHAL